MKKVKELLSSTVIEDEKGLSKHPHPSKKKNVYVYLFKEQINKSICK